MPNRRERSAARLLLPRFAVVTGPVGLLVEREGVGLHPDLHLAVVVQAEGEGLGSRQGGAFGIDQAALVRELESSDLCVPIRLDKRMGETILPGTPLSDQHGWKWPPR